MRFCAFCGAPVVPGGEFCVECGRELAPRAKPNRVAGVRLTAAFLAVFLGILVAGLAVVSLIVPKPQTVSTPPDTSKSSPPDLSALQQPQQSQQQPLQPSQPSQPSQPPQAPQTQANLPAGHPQVELPAEARSFIDKVESAARSKPNDVAAWNRLGDVTMRAAMIDPSYYRQAQEAFGHVLKIDPDDPDALRGVGNLNYDRKNYDQAVAAYEHYLKLRPDDPEVRTDLGTMYLYTGNPDQAVVQYQRALKTKPDFFEGYYNLGIAYGAENDATKARKAFDRALALAPDDASRSKVKEMLAKLPPSDQAPSSGSAAPAPEVEAQAGPGKAPVASGKTKPKQSPAPAPEREAAREQPPPPAPEASVAPQTFRNTIEEMVRNLPVAGDKVQSVKWNGKLKATVLMDNFPMDEMPPFAKQKFLDDLRDGIRSAKAAHRIDDKVVIDLADGATGRVMESVSQ